MKKILLVMLGFIGIIGLANAQSGIAIEASPTFSTFKFTDSQNKKLNSEYSGIITGGYGLGYHYSSDGGFMLRIGAGMRNAGATLEYDSMNYSWKLQYADLKLGLGYMIKNDKISPYLNVFGYYGFLLRAYQTINNEDVNLKQSESINNSDFGIIITPGIDIKVVDELSAYIEFNYLMGLKNIEKDDSQKTKNAAYGLTFGLKFNLE